METAELPTIIKHLIEEIRKDFHIHYPLITNHYSLNSAGVPGNGGDRKGEV